MADYRNTSGIELADGPAGRPSPSRTRRGSIPGSSARPSASPPNVPSGLPSSAAATDPGPATDPGAATPTFAIEGVTSRRRHHQERDHPMTHTGYASDDVLVDADWATGPPLRPVGPLRRGGRRHDGLRAEPPAGRGRVELDEPAGRRHPPRHRDARGLQQAPERVRHRAGHHDHPLRRQQQLVRGVGVLAAQAVRPPRRPDPQRRAQVLARPRPGARRRRPDLRAYRLRPAGAGLRPARLSATTSCRASATRRWRSWTCAARPSSTARSSRLRA